MLNGNGTFVYNGYDADGSWYSPEDPVIPRVYHNKAREKNIKDILYPDLFPAKEEEGESEGEGEVQEPETPSNTEPETPETPSDNQEP